MEIAQQDNELLPAKLNLKGSNTQTFLHAHRMKN
jgi:hypothetical protein